MGVECLKKEAQGLFGSAQRGGMQREKLGGGRELGEGCARGFADDSLKGGKGVIRKDLRSIGKEGNSL